MRAQIIAMARQYGAGSVIQVSDAPRGYGEGLDAEGHHPAPTELTERVRRAIEGWALFFEIERTTAAGDVLIRVLKQPPDLF